MSLLMRLVLYLGFFQAAVNASRGTLTSGLFCIDAVRSAVTAVTAVEIIVVLGVCLRFSFKK